MTRILPIRSAVASKGEAAQNDPASRSDGAAAGIDMHNMDQLMLAAGANDA